MKKILSLIIIGLLCLSTFSILAPQVEAQECSEPEILASGLDEPDGILVHDGSVYWAERQHFTGRRGRIGKVSVDGGDVTTFADIREPTNTIVADDTYIYAASSLIAPGYVKKIRISDGLITDLVPPVGNPYDQPWTNYPFSVTLLGDRVYWSSSTHMGIPGGVWSISKDGGSIEELARLDYHLVLATIPEESWIYMVEIHQRDVMKVPAGGGVIEMLHDAVKLADMTAGFPDIADGYVYWPATAEGKIYRIPTSGGDVEVLAEGENHPYSVLVDDGYVYWTADTSISRVPVDGSGPVELLACDLVAPMFLAIADGYLYWSEQGWSRWGPSPGQPGGPPDPNIGTIKKIQLLTRIPVPYYSQGDDNGLCVPTSMAMIMRYYGRNVHPFDIVDKYTLGRNGKIKSVIWWLTPLDVDIYFVGEGLGVEALRIDWPPYRVDLGAIKDWLDNKWPVMLGLAGIDHAVVLVGYVEVNGETIVYVNDPSGRLLEEWPEKDYESPFIAEEVPWSDLENVFGTGGFWESDWALAVTGEPSNPMGTLDITDKSVTFQHASDETAPIGRSVYSWIHGYDWLGRGRGLDWDSKNHALSLDPEDILSFGLIVTNHMVSTRQYEFEVQVSGEYWLWSRSWDMEVDGLSGNIPVEEEQLWAKDIFAESARTHPQEEYTITLRLWDADRSTLWDEVVFPKVKYKSLSWHRILSPANLYIADPQGRRIGFDPITGETVDEVPDAWYSGPDGEPQEIMIPGPLDGDYVVLMIGVSTGTYEVVSELITDQGAVTQTYTGEISEGEVLELIATVSGNEMTSNPPLPAVSVEKVFKPNEVSAKRRGAVMSRTNITNTGYLDINEITFEDEILNGWTLKDFDHTISATLFIENAKYKIPYEELTYVAAEDGTYVVYINFTDGVGLYQYDPALDQEVYVMTIYAFETEWVLEIKYPMHPPKGLQTGDYDATVSVTVTSPQDISLSVEDTATLHVK